MNLIYVFADQWRRNAMGIYSSDIKTPNLDRFARESMIFDRAYSSCPLCSPNRACLMTGLQPRATNVFTNCKPDVEAYLKEDTICISDIMKKKGYATGYIGKWHLDKPDGSGGWDAYTPVGKKRHGFDFWYSYGSDSNHLHPHYWDTEGKYIQVDCWSPQHETDVALCYLENNKDKDFVLFISYNPPHSPYDAVPKKYEDLYMGVERKISATAPPPEKTGDPIPEGMDIQIAVRQYYGAVTGIDENIGRIIQWLKEHNMYDKTYVMISADHGDMMGDHQLVAKHIWYEGAVGIPLLIGGGDVKAGRSEDLLCGEDQAATILGLLGIPVPESMDGLDCSAIVRGEEFVGHSSIMTMAFPNTRERIQEFTDHGLDFMDYGWRSIITKRYKLAVNKGQEYGMKIHRYLYDLQEDPEENNSIDDPQIMEEMMQELRYWCSKNKDHFILDF